MGVTVRRNFGPLTDLTLFTRRDWDRVGRLARERIVRRTVGGRDVSGSPFPPYSAGYRRAKEAIGAGSTVNLTLSGDMLNAITVEPDDMGVTLAFTR